MAKHAFTVAVFDHGTQRDGSARLVLTASYAGEVDQFTLTEPGGVMSNEDLFRDAKEALGDQLAHTPLEDLDGHEFDGEFAGHYCEITLEQTAVKENDDAE